MKRSTLITVLVVVTIVSLTLVSAFDAQAQTLGTTVPIASDVWYLVGENTYYNGSGMFLNRGNVPAISQSQVAYLKVNLSGASFPINQARVNLVALGGGSIPCFFSVPTHNVGIEAYAVNDSSAPNWSETSLPTTQLPIDTSLGFAPGGLIGAIGEGTVSQTGWYHITDLGGGALSQYLESKRAGGFATIRLQITGAAVGAGSDQVLLEDREGSLASSSYNCPVPASTQFPSIRTPTVQVGGPSNPLTVTLRDFRSSDPAVNWPLYIGLGVLALVIGGLLFYRRRAVSR